MPSNSCPPLIDLLEFLNRAAVWSEPVKLKDLMEEDEGNGLGKQQEK